jgi:2-keto-4-pentenoate hydratase/2-oxohepta-3-ene-1,7-dioic acid hydratase in catechol pathway
MSSNVGREQPRFTEYSEQAMRLVTYSSATGPRVAGLRDGAYVDLQQADASLPASMKDLLALGAAGLAKAAAALAKGTAIDPAGVRLLAPVPDPQKVICIGLNYADHAKESGAQPPPEPVLFNKFPSAIAAHEDHIVLPACIEAPDYEAELVVVIGKAGRNIARQDALKHVAGYCPGHDVSARDWQLKKPGGQWLLGKSFDTFAPYGPALVTSDEVGDAGKLRIRFRLNGETLQDSNTDQLIFPIDALVAYVSRVCTLLPGDIIFTGTPAGVGFARKPPVLLKPGDVAEVEIEKLGVLRNKVVAEA